MTCFNLAGAICSTSFPTGLNQSVGAPTARAHFQRTCASAWGGRLAPRCENAHAGKGIVRGRGKGGQHRRSIGAVIYVPQYVCAATRGLHVNMYLHAHSQSKGYLPAWAQPWKEQLPIDRYMGLSLSDALPTALSLSIRKFLVELNTQLFYKFTKKRSRTR